MIKMSFIPMNLQLFAEDSSVGEDSATPQESTPTETQTTSTVEATTEASTTDTPTAEQTEGATTDTPKSEAEPATQPKQTAEQDRFFADNRRKLEAAEKRATDAEAQRQTDHENAKKYAQYGVFNDADVAEKYGKSNGINTIAELETALRNEEYTKAGIDPEMINKLINEHPAIKEAREAKEANQKSQQDRFLVDSFSELTKEFPSMAKAEDVPADVWRKWNNGSSGITLADAYALVNRKEITAKQADATKQATLNSIQGKGHLQGNGKGVEGDTVRIDDETMALYKRMNPKATTEQIKAYHKKNNK
jgi:membrane protein involved in colicin uptake